MTRKKSRKRKKSTKHKKKRKIKGTWRFEYWKTIFGKRKVHVKRGKNGKILKWNFV